MLLVFLRLFSELQAAVSGVLHSARIADRIGALVWSVSKSGTTPRFAAPESSPEEYKEAFNAAGWRRWSKGAGFAEIGAAVTFDTGITLGRLRFQQGVKTLRFSGFVPAYIRPLFAREGPFGGAALAGEASVLRRTSCVLEYVFRGTRI